MFEKILEIINAYYYVIVIVISAVLLIIQCFVKKNNTKYGDMVDFQLIFNLVNEAEVKFPGSNRGAEKLAYVISKANNLPSSEVLKLVEVILASPEKK